MFKKVTVDLIESYLKKHGWTQFQTLPQPGEKEGMVITGWQGASGQGHTLFIDPDVERRSLIFHAHNIAEAPPDSTPAERLSGVLIAMGALNYELVLGKWSYDPRDGEVVFRLGIPIDRGDLHYDDFEHVLRCVIAAVEGDGPKLKAIVDGTKTAQEVIEGEGMRVGGGV